MNYTLVIDQGTHASRAILFDEQGDIVKQQQVDIELYRIDHETIEQDAEAIIDSINRVIEDLDQTLLSQTTRCSITTQRSTIVAWNTKTGEALYPAISWQDRRSHADLQKFKHNQDDIKAITGLPLSAHYGAGKIRWLLDNSKPVQQCLKENLLCIAPLASFILFRLLKEKPVCVDHSNAQRMLLMDLTSRNWSAPLLTLFNIPRNILPECRPIQSDFGHLDRHEIPVTCVCGDQNASLFFRGETKNDFAYINIGTGAFALKPIEKPITDTPFLCGIANSNHQRQLYLLEATVNAAGAALSWAQQYYPVEDLYSRLDVWLSQCDSPPLFINTIGGLGSPWWNSAGPAYFIDDERSSVAERYTAIVESIVFLLSENIVQMQQYATIKQLFVSGGLSRLDGLCQRLADICQIQVIRSNIVEATARGAAWLACDNPGWTLMEPQEKDFQPGLQPALLVRHKRFIKEISEL